MMLRFQKSKVAAEMFLTSRSESGRGADEASLTSGTLRKPSGVEIDGPGRAAFEGMHLILKYINSLLVVES